MVGPVVVQVVQREQPAVAVQVVDGLVYPTKTVPAPRVAEPVELINLKTV
jgi:hypothetical protein